MPHALLLTLLALQAPSAPAAEPAEAASGLPAEAAEAELLLDPPARVELLEGRASLARAEGVSELARGGRELWVDGPAYLEVRPRARVALRWNATASLVVHGPAVLEWASLSGSRARLEWRVRHLEEAHFEVRRGPVRLAFPGDWTATLETGAGVLLGLPGGGVEWHHDAGLPILLAAPHAPHEVRPPWVVLAGARLRLRPERALPEVVGASGARLLDPYARQGAGPASRELPPAWESFAWPWDEPVRVGDPPLVAPTAVPSRPRSRVEPPDPGDAPSAAGAQGPEGVQEPVPAARPDGDGLALPRGAPVPPPRAPRSETVARTNAPPGRPTATEAPANQRAPQAPDLPAARPEEQPRAAPPQPASRSGVVELAARAGEPTSATDEAARGPLGPLGPPTVRTAAPSLVLEPAPSLSAPPRTSTSTPQAASKAPPQPGLARLPGHPSRQDAAPAAEAVVEPQGGRDGALGREPAAAAPGLVLPEPAEPVRPGDDPALPAGPTPGGPPAHGPAGPHAPGGGGDSASDPARAYRPFEEGGVLRLTPWGVRRFRPPQP